MIQVEKIDKLYPGMILKLLHSLIGIGFEMRPIAPRSHEDILIKMDATPWAKDKGRWIEFVIYPDFNDNKVSCGLGINYMYMTDTGFDKMQSFLPGSVLEFDFPNNDQELNNIIASTKKYVDRERPLFYL